MNTIGKIAWALISFNLGCFTASIIAGVILVHANMGAGTSLGLGMGLSALFMAFTQLFERGRRLQVLVFCAPIIFITAILLAELNWLRMSVALICLTVIGLIDGGIERSRRKKTKS